MSAVDHVARQNAALYALDETLAYEGSAPRWMIERTLKHLVEKSQRGQTPLAVAPLSESQLKQTLTQLRKDGQVSNHPFADGSSTWALTASGKVRLDNAVRRAREQRALEPVAPLGPRFRPSALARAALA